MAIASKQTNQTTTRQTNKTRQTNNANKFDNRDYHKLLSSFISFYHRSSTLLMIKVDER